MIPNEILQTSETLGPTSAVGNFRITDATQARILMSLSDKMYMAKERAVIREYSTNAADAHVVSEKPISDIQVSLPTIEDLNFRIRDFGTGLTEEEIRNVYCVFGESTKRNSNKLNGVLGYGCKAGFAHADSFTVTSWQGGKKTVYQCIKGDSTKLHSAIRLSQEDSTEPSGIEICVPVKQSSCYTFHQEAIMFYRSWPTMPTIKGLSDEETQTLTKFRSTPATLKGQGWEVRPPAEAARGIAYMGWVPYLIDWNVINQRMALDAKSRALFDLLRKNDVILYFEMGEVNFVDSREQLEYTDKTLDVLISRIRVIFEKIKDSIQDKFVGLPTLWHAKIMYNAIFGTGVLESEKGENETSGIEERIKILEGNLMQLENTFVDTFTWNDIVLRGPSFTNINRFDNDFGFHEDKSYTPSIPVMMTYRKKKNRVKSHSCKPGKCDKIVCSPNVAVILNDTGRKTGQQLAARYLVLKEGSVTRTVHVLNFEGDEIKGQFYKEYQFYSVPVIKLSEILPEAKKWQSANKVSRSYGGGGSGARPMHYIDVEDGTVEEVEVPMREIEEGGYYVKVSTERRRRRGDDTTYIQGRNFATYDVSDIVASLQTIFEELDLDVDRIYIINEKTSESKWFQQAVGSGEWKLLWKAIDKALPNLTLNVNHMVDAENYENTTTIHEETAKQLVPLVMDKNSPILELIKTVSGKDYQFIIKVKDAFREIGLWREIKGDHNGTIDFAKASQNVKMAYPYLPWITLANDYYTTPEGIAHIAKYVNAMDLFVNLTRDKSVVPKVESEAVSA